MAKTEPIKATHCKAGHNIKNLTSLELIPVALYGMDSDKSPGNPVVELAPPNGTNNLTEGTNKNEYKRLEVVEPQVGWTSSGNP